MARLCGRKKLPFAGYSVVKELAFRSFSVSAVEVRLRCLRQLRRDSFSPNFNVIDQERFRSTGRTFILRPAIARDQAGPFVKLERSELLSISVRLRAPRLRRTAFAIRRQPFRGLASRSPLMRQLRRRRLENTGLEPVTSWLQTRRSPS